MSDTEIIVRLSVATGSVVLGSALIVLAGVLSRITTKGEAKRNLWLFFTGMASVAGGSVWAVLVFRSFGT